MLLLVTSTLAIRSAWLELSRINLSLEFEILGHFNKTSCPLRSILFHMIWAVHFFSSSFSTFLIPSALYHPGVPQHFHSDDNLFFPRLLYIFLSFQCNIWIFILFSPTYILVHLKSIFLAQFSQEFRSIIPATYWTVLQKCSTSTINEDWFWVYLSPFPTIAFLS